MKKCYAFFDTVDEGRDLRGLVIECLEGSEMGRERCRHLKAGFSFADCRHGGRCIVEGLPEETIMANPSAERKIAERDETILRRLLWLRHGCGGLYGDDGEMQCGVCGIDFLRDPASLIEKRFEGAGMVMASHYYLTIYLLQIMWGYA